VPAGDTCDVWWAAPVDPGSAPGLRALLDPVEQARLNRFRRAEDRSRYLAAHALTRLVLGPLVGRPPAALVFDRRCRCGEQHGKPTLPGGPAFSFTHGGDLVGVAVRMAGGPIGLDVEPVRALSDMDGMARHVGSPAELARGDLAGVDAFFSAWTGKEALLKATGDGIAAPMSEITLGPAGVEAWVGPNAPAGPAWLRALHPAPGYRGAVAGLGVAPGAVHELDGRPVLVAAG
jgi:4'-phosphopantetheinyl transferase